VVGRVVDDVVEGLLVLLLGFDHPRPVALAEDVVATTVALVEGAGIGAVQVAHAVGEVRGRRLEDEVIVVAHQALRVHAPAVAPLDAPQDVEEDHAILAVERDRGAVVPGRPDVVVRPGGEVAARPSHRSTVTTETGSVVATGSFVTGPVRASYVPGTRLVALGRGRGDVARRGLAVRLGGEKVRSRGYAATLERSRC
jgi:hypothetical protein